MARTLNALEREAEALAHWYRAADEPLGIEVKIQSGEEFIEVASFYYQVRKKQADQRLYELALIRSPYSNLDTFWLIRKASDGIGESDPETAEG